MMSSHGIVAEPLNKDNYVKWKGLIKPYLIANDLWDTIKPSWADRFPKSVAPPSQPVASGGNNDGAQPSALKPDRSNVKLKNEDHSREEPLWRITERMNGRALYVIKISCGPEAMSVIVGISNALHAWVLLKQKFKPLELRPLPNWTNTPEISPDYEDFDKMVASGDWPRAKAVLDKYPDAVTTRTNFSRENALHIAISYGHGHIIEELLKRMSDEELEIQQMAGFTALSLAAMIGNIPLAKTLVKRNPKLLRISAGTIGLPVLTAISAGQFDMARYLYPLAKLEDLTGENISVQGVPLLFLCILSKNFGVLPNST